MYAISLDRLAQTIGEYCIYVAIGLDGVTASSPLKAKLTATLVTDGPEPPLGKESLFDRANRAEKRSAGRLRRVFERGQAETGQFQFKDAETGAIVLLSEPRVELRCVQSVSEVSSCMELLGAFGASGILTFEITFDDKGPLESDSNVRQSALRKSCWSSSGVLQPTGVTLHDSSGNIGLVDLPKLLELHSIVTEYERLAIDQSDDRGVLLYFNRAFEDESLAREVEELARGRGGFGRPGELGLWKLERTGKSIRTSNWMDLCHLECYVRGGRTFVSR